MRAPTLPYSITFHPYDSPLCASVNLRARPARGARLKASSSLCCAPFYEPRHVVPAPGEPISAGPGAHDSPGCALANTFAGSAAIVLRIAGITPRAFFPCDSCVASENCPSVPRLAMSVTSVASSTCARGRVMMS